MSGPGVYAYAAVPPGAQVPDAAGIDGAPVRHVTCGPVSVLVSDVDVDRPWETDLDHLEERLRAHQRVVDGAFALGPVVPMRFATVFPTDDDLQRSLEGRTRAIADALDGTADLAEWIVTVTWDPEGAEAELPEAVDGSSTSAGTTYLRARAAQQTTRDRLLAVREQLAEDLHRRLEAVARSGERLAAPRSGTEDVVLRSSYVVVRGGEEELAQAVAAQLDERSGFGLAAELSGPWPAVSDLGEPS